MAAVLIAVPGPSVVFVIGRALAHGRATALRAVVGNAAGEFLQVAVVAAGVGALVESSALVLSGLKLAGAAYLIYLGVRTFRRRRDLLRLGEERPPGAGRARGLLDGLLVGATNPKSAAFFAAVLPQFVVRSGPPAPLQMLFLGFLWVGLALLSDGAWALGAARARSWLARDPGRSGVLGAVSGVTTAGLGLGLLLSGSRG